MDDLAPRIERARAPVREPPNPLAADVRQLVAALDRERAALALLRDNYAIIDRSKFARLRSLYYIVKSLLGRPGRRDRFLALSDAGVAADLTSSALRLGSALANVAGALPRDPYQRWLAEFALRDADVLRLRRAAGFLALRPTFSVVMPTYNTPERYLREAIESVLAQAYPYWELCIADDASGDPLVRAVLEEYAARDRRVRVTYRRTNGMISRASNSALELATGEFVALLDHDDVLTPDALYANAVVVNARPDVDMIYSDEDKIDESGVRGDPFFKPDWSPDTMLSKMYTSHLGVYRRSLVNELGGFRPEYDGSQDWDLVLRLTERTGRVAHIPEVLYHWRVHTGSAASGGDVKPYAYAAARRAIEDALARRAEPGRVELPKNLPDTGSFVVRYALRGRPKISVIVPTRDRAALLRRCVESVLKRSTYDNYEILIIDNGSVEPATMETLADLAKAPPVRVERYDVPFNYSAINNHAVRAASGEVLLFLNNDTEVIQRDWMEAMLEQAQRPPVGAVGAMLLYDDDRIQHAGVVLGILGVAGHVHRSLPADLPGSYNVVQTPTNYIAVTAACMMIRRAVFEEAGGFDEAFAVAFNDVDLCLRVWKAGYRNVYVPTARLYHFESKSRGYDETPGKQALAAREQQLMKQRWGSLLEDDPYYSPHYSRLTEDFALRVMDQDSPHAMASR